MSGARDDPARRRRGARPLADIASALIDPILARRTGMNSALISAWAEIAGPRLAASTRPERLAWAQRRSDLDPFEPATLIVACDGAAALRLQHESGELLQRIDLFFGYHAVGRLKIVQRAPPPLPAPKKPPMAALTAEDRQTIGDAVATVEDEKLRRALERLGEAVLGRNRARRG